MPMVACILAVLKCGGVYVPLDGGITSDAALEHVLSDSGAVMVVASEAFVPRVMHHSTLTVLCMEGFFEECRRNAVMSERPCIVNDVAKDDGAYIIYTSGKMIPLPTWS